MNFKYTLRNSGLGSEVFGKGPINTNTFIKDLSGKAKILLNNFGELGVEKNIHKTVYI